MVRDSLLVTSPPTELFDKLRHQGATAGLNLVGWADAMKFDATQPRGRRATDIVPSCGAIVLLGSGGRANWEFLRTQIATELDEPRPGSHPIDDWSSDVAIELLASLGRIGVGGAVVMPNDERTLNFVQLGEMAGLGTVSPVIHQLMHPKFGPWVSLRAAVLVPGNPFGRPEPLVDSDFQPCHGCHRPCVAACPAETYTDEGPKLERCSSHRLGGGCEGGCEVRRGCPVGAEHRYGPQEEAFRHAYSLFVMRSSLRGWRDRIAGVLRRRRR